MLRIRGCIALVCLMGVANAVAHSVEQDMAALYGDAAMVSIATGSQKPLRLAPAVASVITAAEIAALGATDRDQVLETVPGLHVTRIAQTYTPQYAVRGIVSTFMPQLLLLQNGLPMSTLYLGDKGNIWGGYPVEHIARIEIIRGPGSALYGANAYSGIVNIITKYSRWRGRQVRFGVGHEDLNLYDTLDYKNFSLLANGLPVPTGRVDAYTGVASFLAPQRRKLDYAYAQDEWQLAPDWTLTADLRHDRYSDFGTTTDPRLALVRVAHYDITAKMLLGQACRAPSFNEQYGSNSARLVAVAPVVCGAVVLYQSLHQSLYQSLHQSLYQS